MLQSTQATACKESEVLILDSKLSTTLERIINLNARTHSIKERVFGYEPLNVEKEKEEANVSGIIPMSHQQLDRINTVLDKITNSIEKLETL